MKCWGLLLSQIQAGIKPTLSFVGDRSEKGTYKLVIKDN